MVYKKLIFIILNVKNIDINVMDKNKIAKGIYKKLNFIEYEVKLRKTI